MTHWTCRWSPGGASSPSPLVGSDTVNNCVAAYLDIPATSKDAALQVVVDGKDFAPLHAAVFWLGFHGLTMPTEIPVP